MSNPERPRLVVDLDPGQKEKLKSIIPWGMQNRILREVIQLTIEFLITNGLGRSIDELINGNVKLVIKKPANIVSKGHL